MGRKLIKFTALIALAFFCVFAGGCGKGDDDGADHADRGRRESAGNESDPGQDAAGTAGNGAGNAVGSDSNGAYVELLKPDDYFPYNFEDYASCWGENLLQCYGIRDESGEQIDETSVSGYLDENGYFELDGGTVEYIKESMWDWHGAPQVDDAYVSEPTEIRMYVYRKD